MNPQDDYLAAQEQLLTRYGVSGTSRFVELPWRGLRAQMIEAGDGPPLVFVVGGGGFAAMWTPLLARLPQYTCYAVDRPGFGLTDAVEHRTKTLRDTAVGFLEGLLDALNLEQATIVASSMGSLWTLWFAIDRPERVKRMVHVGCPALLLDTGAPMPLPLLGLPVLGRLMMSLTPPSPRQARMVFASMNEEQALEADLEAAMIATERLPAYAPAWRSLLRSVFSPFGPRKEVALTAEQLQRIRQPVQLIWGENDPFGSIETGQRAAELIPGARFATVPGGHLPWLDSPDRIAALVEEFVETLDSDDAGPRPGR